MTLPTRSILTGPAILDAVVDGFIRIDPFNEKCINPASVDLHLGDKVAVYEGWVDCSAADHHHQVTKAMGTTKELPYDGHGLRPGDMVQDVKKSVRARTFDIDRQKGWLLWPGILYLMHTVERITTDSYVPVLDGKSSIGRLGIVVHLTAGFGDPGFDGQYTLEVTTVHPVRIYPGMRFCQMRFHTMEGPRLNYSKTGHYKGADATGPVPSKVTSQFDELP